MAMVESPRFGSVGSDSGSIDLSSFVDWGQRILYMVNDKVSQVHPMTYQALNDPHETPANQKIGSNFPSRPLRDIYPSSTAVMPRNGPCD